MKYIFVNFQGIGPISVIINLVKANVSRVPRRAIVFLLLVIVYLLPIEC